MRITLLMVAGFLVIAGAGFFLLMRTISEDIERQYSQASEEPLVDFAHLFASLLEQDVRDGRIDVAASARDSTPPTAASSSPRSTSSKKARSAPRSMSPTTAASSSSTPTAETEGQDYSNYNDVFLARKGEYGVRASRDDPDDSRSTVFFIAAPVHHAGN